MATIERIAALVVVAAVFACGGSDQDAADTAADSGRGGSMAEMPGMGHGAGMQDGRMRAMMSEGVLDQMRSHMEQMQEAGALAPTPGLARIHRERVRVHATG